MERLEDSLMSNQNGDLNTVLNANTSLTNQVNTNATTTTTTNTTSTNANTNATNPNERPPSSVSYTMPGILHYLQHEWNRYELDKQQWEVEKAELMTKISFLQGERRGQENLKNNLIRRIKMLELALKQERIKYHKLKFGCEPSLSSVESGSLNKNSSTSQQQQSQSASNETDLNDMDASTFSIGQHPILNKENQSNQTTKQGRQILKQYLQEIGYTDTIIDVRSARLRNLLGLKSLNTNNTNTTNNLSATHQLDLLAATNLLNNNDSIASLLNNSDTKQRLAASIQQNGILTNGGVSANSANSYTNGDVQKILHLNESDAQSMLIMNNLDFNSTNSTTTTNSIYFNSKDYDEEMNDDDSLTRRSQQHKLRNGDTLKQTQLNDLETEDALKEFAFLSNESSTSSSTSNLSEDDASDWNVNKAQLIKLTEEYKKEKKSTKSAKQQQQQQQQQQMLNSNASQRPNRAALQAMIANLNEANDSNSETNDQANDFESSAVSSLSANISAPSVGSATTATTTTTTTTTTSSNPPSVNAQLTSMTFSNSAKLFLEEDDNNLGELSRINVNNSNLSLSGINDETLIDSSSRKTISNKFSLRGHFDSVRCLAFHPTESALVTGSEDQTIKLWNLDKSSINNKKNNTTSDLEPCYTFRKHTGPVLSLVLNANGDNLISSGLDSKIIVWSMPNYETSDQFDPYAPSVFQKYLNGHTDAVWSMVLVDNTLVSVSSDSTIRVWKPFGIDELDDSNSSCLKCLNENKEEGVPTSVDFINNDKSKIVTSFESSHHNVYDLETSKVICRLDYSDSTINSHCYKVLSHPATSSVNSSLIISAHDDKKIRFFDINSGKLVYHMVAHQDACTSLAIDPTCFYLLSSSHDCSLRLWNIETKSCIQEMTAHRKKYDESIHCIAFHPTKPFIASGGADAVVKIYV